MEWQTAGGCTTAVDRTVFQQWAASTKFQIHNRYVVRPAYRRHALVATSPVFGQHPPIASGVAFPQFPKTPALVFQGNFGGHPRWRNGSSFRGNRPRKNLEFGAARQAKPRFNTKRSIRLVTVGLHIVNLLSVVRFYRTFLIHF